MMYSAPGRPRGRCFSPNESSHQARDTRAKLKASLGRRAATHLPFARFEFDAAARPKRDASALVSAQLRPLVDFGSRPSTAVNSLAVQVPGVSLGGGHLLVERVRIGLVVFDSVEVLAVEFGECGAVAGVAEEQVEDGPDE